MSDELRRSVRAVVATTFALVVLIGGAWGDGYLSTRAAYGGLAGLAVASVVLGVAYLIETRIRGGSSA